MASSAVVAEASSPNRLLSLFALTLIGALYVVGFVSHGVLRHFVQTLPIWPAVVLGMRRSNWTKWAALPCFAAWLFLMSLIWLFLLGWVKVIDGTFSPIEITMTIIIALSSIYGIVKAVRFRSGIRAWSGWFLFAAILVLQLVALRISFLPGIAHD